MAFMALVTCDPPRPLLLFTLPAPALLNVNLALLVGSVSLLFGSVSPWLSCVYRVYHRCAVCVLSVCWLAGPFSVWQKNNTHAGYNPTPQIIQH